MDLSNINTVYQSIKSNSKTQSSRKKEELRESINISQCVLKLIRSYSHLTICLLDTCCPLISVFGGKTARY
ncbi:hypothetical protein EB796_005961 [Bugula neritina]|uniref:Uncharacterized protein n=1 Tax=Bugula neritina TaxID=10212 RepID=A0A7J7KBX4_BUGNE|nr:hypothetical protein EB796_005961 [Bugula neritina]